MTDEIINNNNKIENDSSLTNVSSSIYTQKKFRVALGGVIVVILLVLVFFAKSLALVNLSNDQDLISHALTVNTSVLHAVNHYQINQKYSGSIVAGRESDHGFDKAGLLAEILVDEGDTVKKNDVLARLDMRRLNARAKELEAGLAEAIALDQETTALLDRAQASYDRYRVLLNKKHISDQKFEQVKFDLIALKARKVATASTVDKAKAALKSLEVEKNMATLTASFDGSVLRRYQDEGTALSAGTPVIRLIEDHRLEIHVGLPLSAIASLVIGDHYNFDYHDRKITTTLRTLLNKIDQSTRTITAIFDIDPSNSAIRSGGLAEISVNQEIKQSGFWLPNSALAESHRGLWSVYTIEPYKETSQYGTLSRQELQLLYTNGDFAFVRGTLTDKDRIVTNGIHRLVPGQLVRIHEKN
ncbi:MAG: efflux RND transporter periplasmic adaptor subunit [Emcibacter sp.]|nr:efflux RND transporter periplasmic adaptor subunit [Emcibacter sp.]